MLLDVVNIQHSTRVKKEKRQPELAAFYLLLFIFIHIIGFIIR